MMKNNIYYFLVCLIILGCSKNKNNTKTLLFTGGFTNEKSGKGIHVYQFDEATGEAVLKHTVTNIINPSFLKLSKNGKVLYSVTDSQMDYNGKVAAFKVDAKNATTSLINIQDCAGLNPVHLDIDKTGTYLINSNYSDGSLSLFKIKNDGGLYKNSHVLQFKDSSIIKSRQKASHIHSANFSPDNNYVFAHDLGADKIRHFTLDKTSGKLKFKKDIKVKLGSGPRHFTFNPSGKFGYAINELSGKIDAYNYCNGELNFIEEYNTYQQQQDIYRAADIHISEDEKFLYVSNRGPEEDTIAIFSINKNTGKLKLVTHIPTNGKHPRNFVISPSGNFLLVANQFTNNIVVFKRNIKTGKLSKLPKEIIVDNPSSLQMYTYSNEDLK